MPNEKNLAERTERYQNGLPEVVSQSLVDYATEHSLSADDLTRLQEQAMDRLLEGPAADFIFNAIQTFGIEVWGEEGWARRQKARMLNFLDSAERAVDNDLSIGEQLYFESVVEGIEEPPR